ncbi:MAG: universal stress protein, partial [Desulfobacteraceae bacterium]|nr:universal stress protein [Desulfobacteraceae bacterium]
EGNPTEEILVTSKNIKADMIVMGSYGHNILQGALLGGTARKVVQTSEKPVLVIRLPKT